MRWFTFFVFCFISISSANAAENQEEAFTLLQRMAHAAHQLNYSGSFIYQFGKDIETSRITHMKDTRGEYEKLEMLDGNRRQIFRDNDEVYCFLADNKTVMVAKRQLKRSFPALLPTQLLDIKKHYIVMLGEQERVADRDSQLIILLPKDGYRYGLRLWSDNQTGLLLKASTWNEQKEMVDQFFFSDIKIGGAPVDRKEIKPTLLGKRLVRSVDETSEHAMPVDSGWVIAAPPPGFKHLMGMKRVLPGAHMPVNHVVFSDGLAAVSVFIEPMSEKTVSGLSSQGAVHVYTRIVSNHKITVLGEVPKITVMSIGDAISFEK